MSENCLICEKIQAIKERKNPALIRELEHCYFVLGDHQFHKGYCLLLFKDHIREMHYLSPILRQAVMEEVFTCGDFLERYYDSWKINYSCLGNSQPHIHWHIFPRYEEDEDKFLFPWLHHEKFADANLSEAESTQLASELYKAFDSYLKERT